MKAIGLPALLAELSPDPLPERCGTVGELIEAASKVAQVRPATLLDYGKRLRQVAADVGEIRRPEKITSRTDPATMEWRRRVDALPLDILTASAVAEWRAKRIAAAGADRVLEVPKSLLGEVTKALEQKTAMRDRLAAELAAINASTKRPVDAIGKLIASLRDVRRALAEADPATVNAILRAAGVRVTATPGTLRAATRPRPTTRAGRLGRQQTRDKLAARVTVGDLFPIERHTEQVPAMDFIVRF
jgi:small-conductance mechanosensitive channel